MKEDYPGVYLPTEDPATYESTPLAGAGWYAEGQHGGAISGLIAAHMEKTPTLTPMEITRLTVELFRVVPLVPLTIKSTILREGKRIQALQAEILDPKGRIAAMATVLRLRVAHRPTPEQAQRRLPLPLPDDCRDTMKQPWGVGAKDQVLFHRHAVEIREIHGGFWEPGPGAMWARLRKPIVAGQDLTPVQRAAALADFPNGLSHELDDKWVFMNPDLTVHLGRYPTGEWIAVDAVSQYSDDGRGVATGNLWDTEGWFGRTTQSLYLDHATR